MSLHPRPTGREDAERLACRPASERGSAALIGLAMCAFVVIATLATADVGALASARARAQTAADLAALAAVTPHAGGALEGTGGAPGAVPGGLGSPAERASAVATSNGAEVLACACGPLEATITIGLRTRLIPLGTTVRVRAYAKAVLPSSVASSATIRPRPGSRVSLAPPPGDGARPGGQARSAADRGSLRGYRSALLKRSRRVVESAVVGAGRSSRCSGSLRG
jgi:Putative Flp pilus-assembly TadE/G-like